MDSARTPSSFLLLLAFSFGLSALFASSSQAEPCFPQPCEDATGAHPTSVLETPLEEHLYSEHFEIFYNRDSDEPREGIAQDWEFDASDAMECAWALFHHEDLAEGFASPTLDTLPWAKTKLGTEIPVWLRDAKNGDCEKVPKTSKDFGCTVECLSNSNGANANPLSLLNPRGEMRHELVRASLPPGRRLRHTSLLCENQTSVDREATHAIQIDHRARDLDRPRCVEQCPG